MSFTPDRKYQKLSIRYLANDLNLHEENELRHWVDQDEKHSAYFERMFELWEGIKALPEADIPSAEESWSRLEAKVSNTQLSSRQKKSVSRFGLRAAWGLLGLLTVLGTLGWWISSRSSAGTEKIAPSSIVLNGNSYFFSKNSKESYELKASLPMILNPQKAGSWDTLHVASFSDKWIFSVKKGNIILRTSEEQVKLEVNYALYYDPQKSSLVWKKPLSKQ